MAIVRYSYDYGMGEASCTFEVNTEKFTPELANMTLEFFDWYYDKDNDPIDEVMTKYALKAIRLATQNGHNEYGVMEDFKDAEGYGTVDGSIGITLVEVSEYEIQENRLEVEKKTL